MFKTQPPEDRQKLLNFVVSNSTWKDGKLAIFFRQPFDLISENAAKTRTGDSNPDNSRTIKADFGNWRTGRDLNPGGSFTPPTRLAGGRFQPLSHPSEDHLMIPVSSCFLRRRPPDRGVDHR
jgi:hypothetical protein